jgi:hypothetical protein
MDPATIAAALGALLTPYLKKTAEDFVGEAGKYVQGRAKLLWQKLRARLEGDPQAKEVLDGYEADPEARRPDFEAAVEKTVADDGVLRDELAAALAELKKQAPEVRVVQRMTEAEDLTGVRARRMQRGRVDVTQEVGRAKGVTGVDIDEIG